MFTEKKEDKRKAIVETKMWVFNMDINFFSAFFMTLKNVSLTKQSVTSIYGESDFTLISLNKTLEVETTRNHVSLFSVKFDKMRLL